MAGGLWYFSDAPYVGGAEHYLDWHLRALGPGRAGIVALDRPGLRPWLDPLEREGFAVHRLSEAGGKLGPLRALQAWCRAERPDLLHLNMPGPYDALLALGPLAAKTGGAGRVVVTEHLPGVGRVGKRYWGKLAGRRAIDRAIAVCEAHRELMIRLFGYAPERVVSIPNGVVDPWVRSETSSLRVGGEWAQNERHPGLRFVQLGSLDERKGGATLLRAFARALSRGLVANLWFVGEGPARARWFDLARDLGVVERTFFPGHLEAGAEVWEAADVAVLASHREGMPLSLLEAMARARPILATDVDGIPELVSTGRNGWLVSPGDERSLGEAMLAAAASAERRVRYGRESRSRFERDFRRERMFESTHALYDSLTSGWRA